jgi:hypothetical protein
MPPGRASGVCWRRSQACPTQGVHCSAQALAAMHSTCHAEACQHRNPHWHTVQVTPTGLSCCMQQCSGTDLGGSTPSLSYLSASKSSCAMRELVTRITRAHDKSCYSLHSTQEKLPSSAGFDASTATLQPGLRRVCTACKQRHLSSSAQCCSACVLAWPVLSCVQGCPC